MSTPIEPIDTKAILARRHWARELHLSGPIRELQDELFQAYAALAQEIADREAAEGKLMYETLEEYLAGFPQNPTLGDLKTLSRICRTEVPKLIAELRETKKKLHRLQTRLGEEIEP